MFFQIRKFHRFSIWIEKMVVSDQTLKSDYVMKKILYPLAIAASTFLAVNQSFAQELIAITETDMVVMIPNAAAPGSVSAPVAISGLSAGQTIAGSDYRPNTGELIVMGYNATSGETQLYVLNPGTGVASAINATPFVLDLGSGSIGFDFNPTVDRIRVVGANGKNYRLNPVTGSIAATDGILAYAAGDPNFGTSPSMGAAGYTNSYIGTEATTLYVYDESLNILATQNPPNNGVLNTIGSSGIMVNPANRTTDLDIWFNAATRTNMAFLAANTLNTNDDLYQVNLNTGAATSLGLIGSGMAIKDIAGVINRTLPPLMGPVLYALTKTNGNLISFDSQNPSVIRSLKSVSGLTAGQILVGLDVRPATRKLYGLGFNSSTSAFQLYLIDNATGAATAVNASAGTLALGNGPVGFDFNPTVDRIRVVSANGNNYRLNPNNGAIAATDVALSYAPGDAQAGRIARVGSVGYINSFNGSTSTTLFGLDDSIANFVSIIPPNSGVLNSIAGGIRMLNLADLSTDLDFYYDSTSSTNWGYLAANVAGSVNDSLYSINSTGMVGAIGSIGYGIPVRDIASEVTFRNPNVTVAAPTFTPPAGTYASTQMVTLASTTSSATIYYTTNGNTPNPGTSFTKVYSTPIAVNDSMTVKAMATRLGFKNSTLSSAVYNIQMPGVVRTPIISPGSGTFEGQVQVTISSTTSGAEIFYTTNGNLPNLTVPNSFTFLYTGPVTRYTTSTIRAIARSSGITSGYALANLIVNNSNIVAAPTMSPPAGSYPSTVQITLASTTSDVQIYMSTNGITPSNTTPAARLYSTPFNLSASSTIKAIAYKSGFQSSSVSVGIYTIGPGRKAVEDGFESFFYEEGKGGKSGIGEIKLSVFPNPTNGKITIQTAGLDEDVKVTAINSLGQVVFTKSLTGNEDQLDLSNLPSGIYNLQIVSGQFRKDLKITRQK